MFTHVQLVLISLEVKLLVLDVVNANVRLKVQWSNEWCH